MKTTTLTIGDNHLQLLPNGDVEVVGAHRKDATSDSGCTMPQAGKPQDKFSIIIPKAKRAEAAALLLNVDLGRLLDSVATIKFPQV